MTLWGPYLVLVRILYWLYNDLMWSLYGPHKDLLRTLLCPYKVLIWSLYGPYKNLIKTLGPYIYLWSLDGPYKVVMKTSWGPYKVIIRSLCGPPLDALMEVQHPYWAPLELLIWSPLNRLPLCCGISTPLKGNASHGPYKDLTTLQGSYKVLIRSL